MVKTRAQRKAEKDVPPELELEDDGPEIGLDSRTTNLCNLVFDIDLLRETIIDFVIHDHNNREGFSKQNALSCRLVQKSWVESVFKCLVKSGKSLVKLVFGIKYGTSIESFFKIYDSSSPLPFKLKTYFMTADVDREVEKCLHFCNNGLVELELQEFKYEPSFLMKCEPLKGFPRQKFTLPKLRKLTYCIGTSSALPDSDKENYSIDIHSLPQSILSGSLNLKYFDFRITKTSFNGKIWPAPAASCGNLLLPDTIRNLKLDCELATHYLEHLLKVNMLSNLTDLTIDMPNVISGDSEWFSRLLNRVCYTLKNLTVDGNSYLSEDEEGITTIHPPVMKCLRRILIHTVNFEWADGITDLHLKLPALETLDLRYVRWGSLTKWVDNFKFDLLTDLSIKFHILERPSEINFLKIEHAQLMSTAFLNVTKLEICTPCGDTTDKALQCLFQNMTQLQVLTMELREIKQHILPPQYLDALLLGISCQLLDTLKAKCTIDKLWDTVLLNVNEQLSVVNLSQLTELNIHEHVWNMSVYEKVQAFLVSKMPNLGKVKLPRPYKYSKQLTRALTESGQIFNWE